jgi:hypothetical protein
MFESLEVHIKLASPVVFGRFPLQLDSLIFWALEPYFDDSKSAVDAMKSVLKMTDDVFHASQAISDSEFKKELQGRSRNNSIFNNLCVPVKITNTKVRLNLNTISLFTAFHITNIKFYCVGKKDLIKTLLNQLNGIGCFSASGYGQIKNIEINNISEDFSFVHDNKLNKILPVAFIDKHEIDISRDLVMMRARYKPPYTNSKTENCLIPTTELYSK